MLRQIQQAGRRFGVEIGRFPSQYWDRQLGHVLRLAKVDTVVDIGANEGQYGHRLRGPGEFRGRIISLEPGPAAFARLQRATAGDSLWTCQRLAVMAEDGELILRMSEGDNLASFKTSSAVGRATLPEMRVQAEEMVRAIPLDAVETTGRTFVKMDVQGSENDVIDGGKQTLESAIGVQLELPLVALYEDQAGPGSTLQRLEALGLQLVGVQPGYSDPALGLNLEFDAILLRASVVEDVVGEWLAR